MRRFEDAGLPAGHRLEHLEQITSTNTYALERISAGDDGPLWIVADRQTQGRGRRQRTWVSLEGNLHLSFIVQLSCGPQHVAELGFVAGLACYDALSEHMSKPEMLTLKWPNDLLIGSAKTAGLLLERASESKAEGECVVIGFGINIAGHPDDVNFPATHMAEHAPDIEKVDVLEALAQAMVHWLAVWQNGENFSGIRSAWTQRAYGLDQKIAVDMETKRITGTFKGINDNGAMLIETSNGNVETIMAGDYLGLVR